MLTEVVRSTLWSKIARLYDYIADPGTTAQCRPSATSATNRKEWRTLVNFHESSSTITLMSTPFVVYVRVYFSFRCKRDHLKERGTNERYRTSAMLLVHNAEDLVQYRIKHQSLQCWRDDSGLNNQSLFELGMRL